jgi:signal transduction histidine kinase
MRWGKSTTLPGNFFSLTLTLGFLGLCFVEGGIHGHAIAWLVSVPLCALILLGEKGAIKWVVVAFLAAAVVTGLDLGGVNLPVTYDPKWNSVVSTLGYLGLLLFMFLLGYIFESGRIRAYTRLQEALENLAASNERLVYLNNEKNEFLGIAAHDLKNPLNVILGNGELLKILKNPALVNQQADMIISAAERMRHLITDLLDVNAIEEGHFASNMERYDLGGLVHAVVGQNIHNATQKQIVIEVEPSEEVAVRTDRIAARQILDNLISNAVKYSPLKSSVHVEISREKDCGLVRVRDAGPGISEDDQKKLFLKFSRLSARPTGGESSTGLGLAIAKRLAEALSGGIECQSTPGAGATFILRLPLWVEKAAPKLAISTDAGIERIREPVTLTPQRT